MDQQHRIETHHCQWPGIIPQMGDDPIRKAHIAIPVAFHLDEQGNPSVHQFGKLGQGEKPRRPLLPERDRLQLGHGTGVGTTGAGCQAFQPVVMKDHRLAIPSEHHIALDGVSLPDSRPESLRRVLHDPGLRIVQTPVRKGALHEKAQPVGIADDPAGHQRISKTASISTVASSGREDTPTAARA